MRILHVITDLSTGGAEMMLLKLLSAGTREWESHVISLGGQGTIGPRIAKLGVDVSSLGLRGAALNPFRALAIKPITKKFRPSLIVGWMYHGNVAASLARLWTPQRPPVIWNIRQTLYDISNERRRTAAIIRLSASMSRHPAAIVYNSRISAQQHQDFGYRAAKQIVIPNGFDLEVFRPDAHARKEVRDELGLPADAVLVGLIARYHPMKDHAGFLQAAANVARQHSNVYFVLVGNGVTKEQPELAKIAAAQQLQHALLLGERSDLPRITAALDIACSSSAWGEGFSNAVGEAMACGVPCVVTDIGDSGFIIGDTGVVVRPRSPQALADAISRLIVAGAERRQQLGAAARLRVETEFSLASITCRFAELYRVICRAA
ncbi:MAG TPA: glycosyltransferase [Candidatus Angelobacter sp.]